MRVTAITLRCLRSPETISVSPFSRGPVFPSIAVGRRFFARGSFALLLIHPGFRNPYRQSPHSSDHSDALGDRNRSSRVENIEQMRALQAEVVGCQQRETRLFARRRHHPTHCLSPVPRISPTNPCILSRIKRNASTRFPHRPSRSCRRKTAVRQQGARRHTLLPAGLRFA